MDFVCGLVVWYLDNLQVKTCWGWATGQHFFSCILRCRKNHNESDSRALWYLGCSFDVILWCFVVVGWNTWKSFRHMLAFGQLLFAYDIENKKLILFTFVAERKSDKRRIYNFSKVRKGRKWLKVRSIIALYFLVCNVPILEWM